MYNKEAIIGIVKEAAQKVKNVDRNGMQLHSKRNFRDFCTEHDERIQAFLYEELAKVCPFAKFMGEEDKERTDNLDGYWFVIDPIDGTANFIHGYRRSVISLAMLEGGVTTFAAIYDPYLAEMFTAERGGGAMLNGEPIRVSPRTPEHAMTSFGTCPYYKDTLGTPTFRLAESLYRKTRDVRRAGAAALDLAYVAAGRCDIFFELLLSPWDIAAGTLLVEEAGGRVTDLDGAPLSLAAPTPVLASNAVCHDFLMTEAAAACRGE